MFYYINGHVAHIGDGFAVIDCGGIGYIINSTGAALAGLKYGEKAKLYTHCVIREDAFDIYGFTTAEEKGAFEMLLGVSGVGPKVALAILSVNTPGSLSMAIITGNDKALTLASGVGKKLAQRIILELKDKLGASDLSVTGVGGAYALAMGGKAVEAAKALAALGYNQQEISEAMRGIDAETLPLEETVRLSLKNMLKG